MKTLSRPRGAVPVALCFALCVACGARAGSEPAEAPTAPPPAPADPAPVEPASAEAAPEAAPAAPERLASDILSVPDKAWVFSFEGSATYEKAKADCDARFAEDPRERARCLAKARDSFTADAMEFKRDDAGNDVWVIYRNESARLVQVYSVQIEYAEQDGDSVKIRKVGGERGKALLFSGQKEFEVKLGGEYTLELQDDKHGLLAYDARLGFIAPR